MALAEIEILLRQCLRQRINAQQLRDILQQYCQRHKPGSRQIVSAYINCRFNFSAEGDPLLPLYLQEMLMSRIVSILDFVTALLVQWNSVRESAGQGLQQQIMSAQARILTELNVVLTIADGLPVDQLRKCAVLTARWLTATAKWAVSDNLKDNIVVLNLIDGIGLLLVTQLKFRAAKQIPEVHQAVQQALNQCIGSFPSVSMELMNGLDTMQKPAQDSSADLVDSHVIEMAAIQFEESVMHMQLMATRSGTVALVQHLLSTMSTIDDSAIYAFLNTRHSGNHILMFNDLVSASIDAFARLPMDKLYQDQCQIFLLNKVPFVLAFMVTSSFEPFSSEQGLIEAWDHISTSNNAFAPIMRRFLHICSFHHLITSDAVIALVGEDSTLKGLYAKDDLIAQVAANHSRGPRLIDELLKNDGNAVSIAQAVFEIMNNYCHLKQTQQLKEMANTITRKPAAINAIGMFIKPAVFLASFCALLDQWKWDDIHGESQPVYDEFGSIFLVVLSFQQRLQLTDSELGVLPKGFLSRYLGSKNTELKMTDLVQKRLDSWIKSLYIDEGLSDELTTNCSAQDFYMLVPTLLRQSVNAHISGKLSQDALKAGLEYLLEGFLLPSLVPAFEWTKHIALKEPQSAQLVLQILIKPPGGEAHETHRTLLAMAGDHCYIDGMTKAQFTIRVPPGDLAQIASETYIPLEKIVQEHGPLQVVDALISILLQGDFHSLLDFVATMIVISNLRPAVQVMHRKLGHYLKIGHDVYAEAVVHLSRRVELYADALTPQDLAIEPFVPMNVANVNLDAGSDNFPKAEPNADIDRVLNEAAAIGMDQLDNANIDDIYDGLQVNDFALENLDDLDLGMFE